MNQQSHGQHKAVHQHEGQTSPGQTDHGQAKPSKPANADHPQPEAARLTGKKNEAVLGPFTVRDVTVFASTLILFVASLIPMIAVRYNLWNLGSLFFLGLGILLPLIVAALFVARRLTPESKVRIGSLSVDQFASVVASFAVAFFFLAAAGDYVPSLLVALIGSLGLFAATVLAPFLPFFAGDFLDRAEVPAHIVARESAVPFRKPTAPKVPKEAKEAKEAKEPKEAKGSAEGLLSGLRKRLTTTAGPAAAGDPAAAGGANSHGGAAGQASASGPVAASRPAAASGPAATAAPAAGAGTSLPGAAAAGAGAAAGTAGAPAAAGHSPNAASAAVHDPSAASVPAASSAASPAANTSANPAASAPAAGSAANPAASTSTHAAATVPSAAEQTQAAAVGPSGAEQTQAAAVVPSAAEQTRTAEASIPSKAEQQSATAPAPAAEASPTAASASTATMVHPLVKSQEPIAATVDPATRPEEHEDEPVHEAFWFAVAQPRTAVDERTGAPAFVIDPGGWVLALEDRGHEFLVQHTDGRVGLLRDLSNIERG